VAIGALLALLLSNAAFIVDASVEASYSVGIPRPLLRAYVDDIGLLARNMPGVVDVTQVGDDRYLYRTEKTIPLSPPLQTEFMIRKTMIGDSVTVYRSENMTDENYMSCRVQLIPSDAQTTLIAIRLRVRLSRSNPASIHWLAPILGEQFISDRMAEDLRDMMKKFIANSNKELYEHIVPSTATNSRLSL
jgi:hypothetical protein